MKTFIMIISFIIANMSFLYAEEFIKDENIEKAISNTVIFAHSLEKQLYENKEFFKNKYQVLQHYKLGFSDIIAQRYANYSWTGYGVKNGRYAILPPKTVHVLKISRDKATAYFKTPLALQCEESWGFKKFTIVELVFTGVKWLVNNSRTINETPTKP